MQVNTHPPATLVIHLIVIVPTLTTVDDQVSHDDIRIQRLTSECWQGHPVMEKYFKPGTTIVLRCLVTNYRSVAL